MSISVTGMGSLRQELGRITGQNKCHTIIVCQNCVIPLRHVISFLCFLLFHYLASCHLIILVFVISLLRSLSFHYFCFLSFHYNYVLSFPLLPVISLLCFLSSHYLRLPVISLLCFLSSHYFASCHLITVLPVIPLLCFLSSHYFASCHLITLLPVISLMDQT